MRSHLVTGSLLSLFFWSLLSVSLFAAPLMLAERSSLPGAGVEDLIRQHQEAISPLPELPPDQLQSRACEPGTSSAQAGEPGGMNEAGAMEEDLDAPIIRPVGKRAQRIEV